MNTRFICSTLTVFLLVFAFRSENYAEVPPPSERLIVFISDLHFGIGRDGDGNWFAEEDFRWKEEFGLFLNEIRKMGSGKTDLILNGDTFELWQAYENIECERKKDPTLVCSNEPASASKPAYCDPFDPEAFCSDPPAPKAKNIDCDYENPNMGCSEQDALKRVTRVLEQHSEEIALLRDFAKEGENKLILVPGNHDAALLFEKVGEKVRQSIGLPDDKADHFEILRDAYWVSPDKRIYAEHGHQIGEDVNRFCKNGLCDWPNYPFIEVKETKYIQKTWGERGVEKFYNWYESEYPVIDNISKEGTGIKYGVAAAGVGGTFDAVGDFLKFFLLEVSWDQFLGSLGKKKGIPEWNIEKIKKTGNQFFVNSLPKDHPFYILVKKRVQQNKLDLNIFDLTPTQINKICDQRERLKIFQIKKKIKVTVSSCPIKDPTLGAIKESLFGARDQIFMTHLNSVKKNVNKTNFDVFIFSHTHRNDGFTPFEKSNKSKKEWNPKVLNTGAWQRTMTPKQIDEFKSIFGKDNKPEDKEILVKIDSVEKLPPCYGVVYIEPYIQKNGPSPKFRFWSKKKKNVWKLREHCPKDWLKAFVN